MLIHNPRTKSVAVIERISPSYATLTQVPYRARRFLPSGMYLYLAGSGQLAMIVEESDELLNSATATIHDTGLRNAHYIVDRNDDTYGYTESTVDAGAELPLVTYDIGAGINGAYLIRPMNNAGTSIYLRIYISGDGVTWTRISDFNTQGTYTAGVFPGYLRYLRLAVYNAGSSPVTLNQNNFRIHSFECYQATNKSKIVGDNSVKTVTVFVRMAYYQLLEVWEF